MAVTEADFLTQYGWVHSCGQTFWWKDQEGLLRMAEAHERACGHVPDWWLDY